MLNFIPTSYFQQMAPTKQAKVIKDFQKQSAQLDMTVSETSHNLKSLLYPTSTD